MSNSTKIFIAGGVALVAVLIALAVIGNNKQQAQMKAQQLAAEQEKVQMELQAAIEAQKVADAAVAPIESEEQAAAALAAIDMDALEEELSAAFEGLQEVFE